MNQRCPILIAVLLLLLPAIAQAGTWTNGTVTNSSGSRNYKLWIPAGYTGKSALSLVMMLHGCTQTPDDYATGTQMNRIADKENFLVVYPEQPAAANALKCWNWFEAAHQSRGQGEPSLLAEIVKKTSTGYRVNSRRVFVAGVSAGAAMAVIMGATYPDLFAALGVHSGLAYKSATNLGEARPAMSQGAADPMRLGQLAFQAMGKSKHRMPVIVFQGTKDGAVASVNADKVISQWARTNDYVDDGRDNNSVDDVPEALLEGSVPGGYAFTKYAYYDRFGKLLMEKWIIKDMKHAWSGGAPAGTYTDAKGPNASQEMWRFFEETTAGKR
jgi:poly(hydroxyalkanoate) depolymerase family esterase